MGTYKSLLAAIVGAGLFAVADVQAATITWTGTVSTDFATTGNWSTNVAPLNDDYSDVATFTENSPSNRTPNLAAGRAVGGINFSNSTGWTLSGSQLILRTVQSSGAGTNTVSAPLKTAAYNVTWTIGSGNTVALSSLYQDNSAKWLHIGGGGTMTLATRIDGWATTNSTYVDNATLKFETATPYVKSGNIVYINADTSVLQLKTTVSAVQTLISSNAIQGTGGRNLQIRDIGGGYVQVYVPEPATAAIVSMAGLAGLAVRPRRRA